MKDGDINVRFDSSFAERGGGVTVYRTVVYIVLALLLSFIPTHIAYSAPALVSEYVVVSGKDVVIRGQQSDTLYIDTLSIHVKASSLIPFLLSKDSKETHEIVSVRPHSALCEVAYRLIVILGILGIGVCAILIAIDAILKREQRAIQKILWMLTIMAILCAVAFLYLINGPHGLEMAIAVISGIFSSVVTSYYRLIFTNSKNKNNEDKKTD